jgi:antitoxin VapB
MSVTVKLFMQDDCQALELPDEFRFEGEEVWISKVGDKIILEPIKMPPPVDSKPVAKKPDALGSRDVPPDDPSTEPEPRIVRDD